MCGRYLSLIWDVRGGWGRLGTVRIVGTLVCPNAVYVYRRKDECRAEMLVWVKARVRVVIAVDEIKYYCKWLYSNDRVVFTRSSTPSDRMGYGLCNRG